MTDNNRAEATPCWYVKDFADGWIKFYDGSMALKHCINTGAIMCCSKDGKPPMVSPPPPDNAEAVRNVGSLDIEETLKLFPDLEKWILRLANTPIGMSVAEWSDFLRTLNAALTNPAVVAAIRPQADNEVTGNPAVKEGV